MQPLLHGGERTIKKLKLLQSKQTKRPSMPARCAQTHVHFLVCGRSVITMGSVVGRRRVSLQVKREGE
jgi:hypothetical protein